MADTNRKSDVLTKRDLKLGGPGLDGYAYNVAMYCIDCGHDIIDKLPQKTFTYLEASDTEQVPVPSFFGESDQTQHCDDCGEYLYGGSDE